MLDPIDSINERGFAVARVDDRVTANDRFKRRSRRATGPSLLLAAAAHAALLAADPGITVHTESVEQRVLEVESVPQVALPLPPAPIAEPAMPTIASIAVTDSVAIAAAPGFAAASNSAMVPPPAAEHRIDPNMPAFVAVTTYPRLLNREDAQLWTEYEYPSILEGTAIAGAPLVWILLDETGSPVKTQIHESSGYPVLDRAALRIAHKMRFSPAENRGVKVPVWVSIAIRF